MVKIDWESVKKVRLCKECGKRLPFLYRKKTCHKCLGKEREEKSISGYRR